MKQKSSSGKELFTKLIVSEYFILMLSIVYFIIIGVIRPNMFSAASIKNILSNMWPLLAVCLGQTFVLLLGGIDLSQTAVISFCSTVAGILIGSKFDELKFAKSPIWGKLVFKSGGLISGWSDASATIVTFIVVLLVGILIGFINGVMIAKLNIPPFMTTLISQMFWQAIALWLTSSQNCPGLKQSFNYLGKGKIVGIFTMPLLIVLILLIVCEFFLSKTIYGRWIYSVGANKRAAVISGIHKDRVIMLVYSLSGFCAAIGSIIYTGRQEMGRPTLGNEMLNDVLGATVIGGVSMYGGKGKALWALYGVFFYCIMTTSMNMLRFNSFVIQVIKGFIILLAVSFDVVRNRMQEKIAR